MSKSRNIDGIWIESRRGEPADLMRVEAALQLIKQHSPIDYARVVRELERIRVDLLFYAVGAYRRSIRACIIDSRYMDRPDSTVERLASIVVHEATHARLERYGIEYNEERRARIEAICYRRQLAFAARLPDSAELQQEAVRWLEWCQANPDHYRDSQIHARRAGAEIDALRHFGAPEWLIRTLPVLRWMIDRTTRLFRVV